jgi:hypothetical protein
VIYNGPAQFDFAFGATAIGPYIIDVAGQGATIAILDVTVL